MTEANSWTESLIAVASTIPTENLAIVALVIVAINAVRRPRWYADQRPILASAAPLAQHGWDQPLVAGQNGPTHDSSISTDLPGPSHRRCSHSCAEDLHRRGRHG